MPVARPPPKPLNASERGVRFSSARAFSSTFVKISAAVSRDEISFIISAGFALSGAEFSPGAARFGTG
jgi:hypothetical protein